MSTKGSAKADPWADMVAAAKVTIERAEAGNSLDARNVLKQAAVALRDVLGGRLPDRERIEYLRFLLGGLDAIIDDGIKPARALGLEEHNRPPSVPPGRDAMLFFAVGLAFDKRKNVTDAVRDVDNKYGVGRATARKAWQSHGGKAAWERANEEWEKR